jgi:hypothetical protein
MTRHEQIQAILDQHADALRGLRAASTAFDAAFEGMRVTLTAIHDANRQQGVAIDAVIAANQAAVPADPFSKRMSPDACSRPARADG